MGATNSVVTFPSSPVRRTSRPSSVESPPFVKYFFGIVKNFFLTMAEFGILSPVSSSKISSTSTNRSLA